MSHSKEARPDAASLPAEAADTAGRQPAQILRELHGSALFQDYRHAFEAAIGLPLALQPARALHPPMPGSAATNPFCALVAFNGVGCAACEAHRSDLEAATIAGSATQECFAGMVESAIPIRIDGQWAATLRTGQVFLQNPTKARFDDCLTRLSAMGSEPAEASGEWLRNAWTAYSQTSVIAPEAYDAALRMLEIFAQQLSMRGNLIARMRDASELPAIAEARRFIAEHLDEEVPLARAARVAKMSPFQFCRTFKRATGLAFMDYRNCLRVEKAKRLLLEPGLRIGEVGVAAGFGSRSQFNRGFLKVTGRSPREFRACSRCACPGGAGADASRVETTLTGHSFPEVRRDACHPKRPYCARLKAHRSAPSAQAS